MNSDPKLPFLRPELHSEVLSSSEIMEFPAGTEILRQGQYVKVVPIVLKGLIKVYTCHSERELLLYYIRPNESCIMSFSSSLKNKPSKVYAMTEEDTRALLLPVNRISDWSRTYPDMNELFFEQFNLRYCELLDTIHHVLFDRMDKRLYDYLKEKTTLTRQNPIKLSHRQIANELGTAREVISRTMKKLESESRVKQHSNSIEILK